MFCTHCGEQIEDNSRYCTYCGGEIPEKFRTGRPDRKQDPAIAEPATAVSVQGSPALSRTSKPRKKTGLITAVLLIAAAAAAGIWFFLNRSSRPVQNPESQAQAGESANPVSDDDEWTVEYLAYELQSGNSRFIYEYDDYGNQTKLTCYKASPDTEITEDSIPGYIIEDTYKKKQHIKHVYTDFKDGEPVSNRITTYSYDSNGFLISEETTTTNTGEEPKTSIVTYENDAQGNHLIRRTGQYADYSEYDSDGNCVQKDSVYEKDGTVIPQDRWVWEYDEEGNLIRRAHYNYDTSTNDYSDLVEESQYEHNEHGDITTDITRDYKNPENSTITSLAYEYDENGNMLKEIRTEPNGTISTFKCKPYRIRKTKDK